MGVINLTKILKGKTGWVSISSDSRKVVARAKTLKVLVNKLKRMDNPDGSIIYLPSQQFSSYVG